MTKYELLQGLVAKVGKKNCDCFPVVVDYDGLTKATVKVVAAKVECLELALKKDKKLRNLDIKVEPLYFKT